MHRSLLLLSLGLAAIANAELISVQFQGNGTAQNGAAATGAAGDIWNHVTATGTTASNISLTDSTGAATGVQLSYSVQYGLYSNNGAAGYGSGQGLSTGYLATFGTTGTLTLTGLTASQAYTLYTYDQRDTMTSSAAVSVNGGTVQTTHAAATSSYVLGTNYLIFNTAADATGKITINFSRVTDEADFNGFQLSTAASATPEPGTFGLLGAGLLALLYHFRRKNGRVLPGFHSRTLLSNRSLLSALFLLTSLATLGSAEVVTVSAQANIYGAGFSTAPDPASSLPPSVTVTSGQTVTFSITGGTNSCGSTWCVTLNGGSYNDADGIGSVSSMTESAYNGISGISNSHAGFLVGVFEHGTPSGSAPASLNFTTLGTSFSTLSPLLNQTFFIGDGLTGDNAGSVQQFIAPTGATTLYLGFADAGGYNGYPVGGYSDNSGSLQVTTNSTSATPEPGTWTMLTLGLGGVGIGLCRRNRN